MSEDNWSDEDEILQQQIPEGPVLPTVDSLTSLGTLLEQVQKVS
jgi:hypothetical protein